MSQNTFSENRPYAVAGQQGEIGLSSDVIAQFVANEDLPFGRTVRLVSGSDTLIETPKDDSGVIVGATLYDLMRPQNTSPTDGLPVIKAGTQVRILRRGRIWLAAAASATDGFTVGAACHVSNDSTHTADYGKATNAATSSNAVRALNGAVFWRPIKPVAGGLVMVELSLS